MCAAEEQYCSLLQFLSQQLVLTSLTSFNFLVLQFNMEVRKHRAAFWE